MPGIAEVRFYLTGLWLLLRGDASGLHKLDLTDRGALRSFWAALYAFPPMLLSWIWWHQRFLELNPSGADVGAAFFVRVALVEACNWIVPLVLVGLIALSLGFGARFAAIVTAANWLSVPVSYLFGFMILLLAVFPGSGLVAFATLLAMFATFYVYVRVLIPICNDQMLMAVTLTLLLLLPTYILSDVLERFLGIFTG